MTSLRLSHANAGYGRFAKQVGRSNRAGGVMGFPRITEAFFVAARFSGGGGFTSGSHDGGPGSDGYGGGGGGGVGQGGIVGNGGAGGSGTVIISYPIP